jgi:hypothetical protein
MSFWIYVTLMLTLPRLLYRLLHEGKPYSELPTNYHYTCRVLDSLWFSSFFALLALSGFQSKWKTALCWLAVYPLLAWLVHSYTAKRAEATTFRTIRMAFPEMTEEKFDPNSLLESDGEWAV